MRAAMVDVSWQIKGNHKQCLHYAVDPVDLWGKPPSQTLITEAVCGIFRGGRDGMLRKIFNPVLETHYGDV